MAEGTSRDIGLEQEMLDTRGSPRDARAAPRTQREERLDNRIQGAQQSLPASGAAGRASESVSYTHLTLPTNREV